MQATKITNFSSIINNYQAVFLDLWGVVHDGTAMYPGAKECMEQMALGKGSDYLLAQGARLRLKQCWTSSACRGFLQGHLYFRQVAYRHMERAFMQRYVFIGPDRDADVLDGLGRERVDKLETFLLNVVLAVSRMKWRRCLSTKTKALSLPMLCLNQIYM